MTMPSTSPPSAPVNAGLAHLTTSTRRRPTRIVALVAVLAVIAAAVAGLSWSNATASTGPRYRTASAQAHEVEQTLMTVAVIEPVTQAAVAFPIDGTVAAVDVAEGDTVAVGQTLARLDSDDLQDAVDDAQASLANARLTYRQALDGELPTGGVLTGGAMDAAASPEGATGDTALSSTESWAPSADANPQLQAAQEAVDADLDAVSRLLDAATASCTGEMLTTTQPRAPTTPTLPTPTAGADVGDPSTPVTDEVAAPADGATGCADAFVDLTEAQRSLEAHQADLAAAISGSQPSGQATTPTTTTVESTASADAATNTVSDQALIAHGEAVDAAEADVAAAARALGRATIVSPIDGTVVDLGFANGDEVTAASDTQAITVVSDEGYELTTDIDVADLPDIEVGQRVVITPDAAPTQILDGEIIAIAVTPEEGTSTYKVTIGVSGDTSSLRNGGLGTATIVTASADAQVAVPTSALTPQGADHTVTILEPDGTTTTRTVTVGAVGRSWTEITGGLRDGEGVVVADLDEPLPGSATDTGSSAGGTGSPAGGRFPGGGGGGFPGGGGFAPPGS